MGRLPAAKAMLQKLVAVNTAEPPFPEWLHAKTGRSMGEIDQAWSASGLLYATSAVATGRAPLFDDAVR